MPVPNDTFKPCSIVHFSPLPASLKPVGLLWLAVVLFPACQSDKSPSADPFQSYYQNWAHYLGDPGRSHYTTLDEITPENVHELEVAWTYAAPDSGQMQMNPIIANGMLYGVTAGLRAFALDAATGEEVWRFGDPGHIWHSTSRGISYWEDGADKRVLYTSGAYLYALNALDGRLISSFGDNGRVDLHTGLPAVAKDKFIVSNTPGTIFDNLIIMPTRVGEGAGAAPGDIRAFDVRTGALIWTFHTIPHPGEPGYDTWSDPDTYLNEGIPGGANNWAGMALDPDLGIVYIPTGSASPDFYGGHRLGDNLYADCLLALNARTGAYLWHYQFVHHDLWDRDPPAPPNLIKVTHKGKPVDAVAQITKQGFVFVFDRRTGEPLFDIEEVPVPPSRLEGEQASPTQPVPVKPRPFARQAADISVDNISPYAPNPEELQATLRQLDNRRYAPPAIGPVLLLPGYDGGAEWGGAGTDPEKGILYVNANEMPWILQMEPAKSETPVSPGAQLYLSYCAACHQKDRQGLPQSGYPALTGIANRLTRGETAALITNGKGMMPGFPQLEEAQKDAILDFLYDVADQKEPTDDVAATAPLPYRHTGYTKFLDAQGLPAIAPPWGTLHAIDLNTGEYHWSIPLGDTDSLKAAGHPPTGCENYGGPVITANGLLFIAATKDGYFRAFNRHTGALLWSTRLPAAAFATPATYEVEGRQYIAVACGGEKLGTPKGNVVVGFALPQ
ncbi:MAG: PQQ-binding-like beta-propeller repeat protein [bacterium]|nr:PQQ-binding-like beta-propeller repeat protein [bacterium]